MDLSIDNLYIEKSFDRIAVDLLTKMSLFVNAKEFQITEIEFYYHNTDYHRDNYTHDHDRNEGEWRFHNQGLDITLQANDAQVGGILIRGIKVDNEYINGPLKIIMKIFEEFNKVTDSNTVILRNTVERPNKIIKTFRHLPNKHQDKDYHYKPYRYLVNFNMLEISPSEKDEIRIRSVAL